MNNVIAAQGIPLLPGGVGRDTFFVGAPTPRAVSGAGYLLVDEQGHELIDGNGNHTSLVHGIGRSEILESAERALRDGSCWGMPNQWEWEHAEALLARLDWLDQVRYANSGSEAVMTALRLARAHTGREKVLMLEGAYHGSSDSALVAGGAQYVRGIPAGTRDAVVTAPLNDLDALRELVQAHATDLAAIIIDAMPNRAGLVSISPEYLALARALATEVGAVLILDEVISLRLGLAGMSGICDVQPDLLTAGKYIGGGFPIGAVVGRAEIMAQLDPRHPQTIPNAGTFTGNPVSMAAGRVALELMTSAEIDRINGLGDQVRSALTPVAAEYGWEIRGFGSLLRPFPASGMPSRAIQQTLWHAAYREGLLLTQSNLCALSTAMDRAAISELTERYTAALRVTLSDAA